jgi:hypothetical protein
MNIDIDIKFEFYIFIGYQKETAKINKYDIIAITHAIN